MVAMYQMQKFTIHVVSDSMFIEYLYKRTNMVGKKKKLYSENLKKSYDW